MRIANLLAGCAALSWLIIAFVGMTLILGIVGQNVLGYPTTGQIMFYVVLPTAFAITVFLALWHCNVRKKPTILVGISTVSILALMPFLAPYTGGI